MLLRLLVCEAPTFADDPNSSLKPDLDADIHADIHSKSYDHTTASYRRIPAPQFVKHEEVQRLPALPTTESSVYLGTPGLHTIQQQPPSESLQKRPYPRMRPVPPPSPVPAPHGSPVVPFEPSPTTPTATVDKGKARAMVTWPPSQVVNPSTKANGSPVYSTVPGVLPTGPFVGHGIMNQIRFKQSSAGPSGLRIKRSPSPPRNHSSSAASLHQTKLNLGVQPFKFQEYQVAGSMLQHSGRESSPINLCSSSVYDEAEGVDDSDYEGETMDQAEDEDMEIPEEVEGVEEAHHRAASSSRSSSPPELRDIIIKGGEPTIPEAELDALLNSNRHSKLWLMPEKGRAISHIFSRDVPRDRYLKALIPVNPKRPGAFWMDVSTFIHSYHLLMFS